MKKFFSLLMALCIMCSMSIVAVNADETTPTAKETKYDITIVDNTVTPAVTYTVTGAELDKLASTKGHSYSGINNQGTVNFEKSLYGVELKTLLTKNKIKFKNVKSIEFDASGDKTTLNTSDLFAKRYYYSKLDKFNSVQGKTLVEKAKKNAKVVVPIIALGDENAQNAKLYFGQKYASERNWPKFWGNVTTITVNKTAAKSEKWETPEPTFAKEVKVGTPVSFKSTKGFIYYTMNGKKPLEKNAFVYNYGPKQNLVNAKVFKKAGKYTVKAVIKGFGKKDSKVKTFKVKVLSAKAYDKKYPSTSADANVK